MSRAPTVAKAKNKRTQRCRLRHKESGPRRQNRREKLLWVLVLSSENRSSGSSSSVGRSSQRSLVRSATTPKGSTFSRSEFPASFASKRASGDRENFNAECSPDGSNKPRVRLSAVNLVPCTPFTKVVREDDSGNDMLSVSGSTWSEADRSTVYGRGGWRVAKTPAYWIRKFNIRGAMMVKTDKWDLNQATEAIARAKRGNVDPERPHAA